MANRSPSALPYREKPPPYMPPCPWCRGNVVLVLIGGELAVYCTECPWHPDADERPEAGR